MCGSLQPRFSAWAVIRQQPKSGATIRLKWPTSIGLRQRQRLVVATGKILHRRLQAACSWATSQLSFPTRLMATTIGVNSIPLTRGQKRQKLESYITLRTRWRAAFAMRMNPRWYRFWSAFSNYSADC